jgi:hypothetical protein
MYQTTEDGWSPMTTVDTGVLKKTNIRCHHRKAAQSNRRYYAVLRTADKRKVVSNPKITKGERMSWNKKKSSSI